MGILIFKGTEDEARKEFVRLLTKVRVEFEDAVVEKINEFEIGKSDIRIIFILEEFSKEYAIYQVII